MFTYQKTEFKYTTDFLGLPYVQSPIFNPIKLLSLGDHQIVGTAYQISQVFAFDIVFHIDTSNTDPNYQFKMNSFEFKTSSTNSNYLVMDEINLVYSKNFFDPILGNTGVHFLRVGCSGNLGYILPSFSYNMQQINPTANPPTMIIFPLIQVVTSTDE